MTIPEGLPDDVRDALDWSAFPEPIIAYLAASQQQVERLQQANAGLAELVPTNWCDPLLTGPEAALHGKGGTWGCPDIERLLTGIKKRIDAAIEGQPHA